MPLGFKITLFILGLAITGRSVRATDGTKAGPQQRSPPQPELDTDARSIAPRVKIVIAPINSTLGAKDKTIDSIWKSINRLLKYLSPHRLLPSPQQ